MQAVQLSRLQRILRIVQPETSSAPATAAAAEFQKAPAAPLAVSTSKGLDLDATASLDLQSLADSIRSMRGSQSGPFCLGRSDLAAEAAAAQASMHHPASCASLLRLISVHSRANGALAAHLSQGLVQALAPPAAKGAKVTFDVLQSSSASSLVQLCTDEDT